MDASQLVAIEEIKQLKARYFYHLDHKNWDAWRDEVFMPDAIMDVPETHNAPYVGMDAILEMLIPTLGGVTTVHHGHMPIIEITSSATAKGIWAMEDVLFWPNERFPGMTGRVHGYGHYHETYVKTGKGWRIQSLRLTRLHLGPMP